MSNPSLPTQSGPRRFRFSLRSLLLTVTISALVLGDIFTWVRLRQTRNERELLRTERDALRSEMGYLTISDANCMHAIQVPSLDALNWRWRVYLPTDRRYRICWATTRVPLKGLPAAEDTHYNEAEFVGLPKEPFLLQLATYADPQGVWQLRWQFPTRGTSVPIREGATDWLRDPVAISGGPECVSATRAVQPGEPLVLLRLRRSKLLSNATTIEMTPTDGIMVWLAESPSTP